MRTIANISSHLKRLDKIITTKFILVTDGINCSDIERKLMPLPPKLDGMRITISSDIADREYEFSQMLSNNSLTSKIINKDRQHQKTIIQWLLKSNF